MRYARLLDEVCACGRSSMSYAGRVMQVELCACASIRLCLMQVCLHALVVDAGVLVLTHTLLISTLRCGYTWGTSRLILHTLVA